MTHDITCTDIQGNHFLLSADEDGHDYEVSFVQNEGRINFDVYKNQTWIASGVASASFYGITEEHAKEILDDALLNLPKK